MVGSGGAEEVIDLREGSESKRWMAAALPIGVLALFVRLAGGVWPIDDAFITFRYARNFAAGLGLVYNADQSVLGTSTPLFALMLAGLAKLSGADIPQLAAGVSAVADGAGTLLVYGLARRLSFSTALCALCSLCWAFYPLSLKYAMGGMETSLVSALILGAFLAWLSEREGLAMALAGAAVLARPDALAAAFAIAVGMTISRRRVPWRPLIVFLAILIPWLLFATASYGNPLPQSIQAKSHSIYRVQPLENARQIAFHLGGLILGSPIGLAAEGLALSPPAALKTPLINVATILFPVWVVGAVSAVRRDRRWLAFFGFPVVFAAAYAVLGLRGSLLAEWYLVPLTPFWLLGLFYGLSTLFRQFAARRAAALTLASGALIAIAQVAGLNWGRDPSRSPWVPSAIWTVREGQYRQAAEFLKPHLRTGDVVAAPEIGAIGYYCDCLILDTVGLVSPEAVPYYPLQPRQYVINYAVPPKLIREAAPEYLITLDVFVRRSLLIEEWFQREYRIAWELDTRVFGSSRLLIFARRREGVGVSELPSSHIDPRS